MSDDLRFDALLTEGADALPPPADVSPWRSAMHCIVWGIALKTLTLQILYLHYILPTLGCILLVLGFRTLRQENRALRWAYDLSLAAAVMRGVCAVLQALPVDVGLIFGYADSGLMLGILIALWRGMTGVARAAGAEKPSAPAAGTLAAFYAVLLVLAHIGLEGWLLVLPVLAVYLVILRNLVRLFRSLADTGYAIHAAPVRLPAAAVLWGYLGLTLAAVVLAMLLGQRYPMDWQVRQDAPQDAAIRAELLELGFPQDVLDDLTAEEVAGLAGASEVLTQTDTRYDSGKYRVVTTDVWDEDTPNTWQYQSAEKQADGTYRYTYHVYDVEEVCTMTHVAVVLPQGGYQRVVFLHHLAARPKGLALTEGVEIWPMWRDDENWARGNIIGGRVLCGRQGQTYTADFAALDSGSYTSQSFFGNSQRSCITAEWSRLRGAEDLRAYVLYDAETLTPAWEYLESWCNYARPDGAVYPFRSALARWHSWGLTGGDTLIQSALQEWADNEA